jgi:hypothetical protein
MIGLNQMAQLMGDDVFHASSGRLDEIDVEVDPV